MTAGIGRATGAAWALQLGVAWLDCHFIMARTTEEEDRS